MHDDEEGATVKQLLHTFSSILSELAIDSLWGIAARHAVECQSKCEGDSKSLNFESEIISALPAGISAEWAAKVLTGQREIDSPVDFLTALGTFNRPLVTFDISQYPTVEVIFKFIETEHQRCSECEQDDCLIDDRQADGLDTLTVSVTAKRIESDGWEIAAGREAIIHLTQDEEAKKEKKMSESFEMPPPDSPLLKMRTSF